MGPPISQALDYHRAVFPTRAFYTVSLEWIFIWPTGVIGGDIGSIMAQNRIGAMSPYKNGITFFFGDGCTQSISAEHGVNYRRPKCGYKVGSR